MPAGVAQDPKNGNVMLAWEPVSGGQAGGTAQMPSPTPEQDGSGHTQYCCMGVDPDRRWYDDQTGGGAAPCCAGRERLLTAA